MKPRSHAEAPPEAFSELPATWSPSLQISDPVDQWPAGMNLHPTISSCSVPERFAQDRAAPRCALEGTAARGAPRPLCRPGRAAQRVAMQWSVRINEAYQRLKDPLRRAAYLCELRGAPIQAESNTAMPAAS
jgi:molecular chaperone HscB